MQGQVAEQCSIWLKECAVGNVFIMTDQEEKSKTGNCRRNLPPSVKRFFQLDSGS